MEWKIVDTGSRSAEENMGLDAELLEHALDFEGPLLHLYEWSQDSATFGYFTDPYEWLSREGVKKVGLNLAKRPTGGGIIFHLWDLAFSVLVPAHAPEFSINTLENYAFVNNAVAAAVQEYLGDQPPLFLTAEDGRGLDPHCMHFCMAKPTKYDVMRQGRKVAGAAQRRTKQGFLHQGSISLLMPPVEYLEQVLVESTQVNAAMQEYTCPVLGGTFISKNKLSKAKRDLSMLLATHLRRASVSLRA